jgi:hypothetical protein
LKKKQNKNGFIHVILLGFLLISSMIGFVATNSDEYITKNKYFELEQMSKVVTRALAKDYMYNKDLDKAEEIAFSMLSKSKLGNELVSKNLITFDWVDEDNDGELDYVTTSISGYKQNVFWYRFFNKSSFDIPSVLYGEYVSKENSSITSMSMRYGGSDAGYDNMIGLYEIDENGNCVNTRLILANRNLYSLGDEIGVFTNMNTRFFVASNGYNLYGNKTATINSSVSIANCNTNNPRVTINGRINSGPVYFQDARLNLDGGYDHVQEVGKTYFDDYLKYIEGIDVCVAWKKGKCSKYEHQTKSWEDWVVYADENNIDFANDPNDEYIIAMEDLPNGGDADFNDIKLDTTKIRTPNRVLF